MAKQDYIIGLDLGIASVGWACVKVAIHTDKNGKQQAQPIGLLDCGVRCFAAAEEPKTGESLNAARRAARSQRRTIARRASRMREVRKLLFKHGLLTKNEFQAAYSQNTQDKTFFKERNKKLLKKIGISEQQLFSGSLNGENGYQSDDEKAFFTNVWQLRVEALNRLLTRAEFVAVICHLIKHRGYLSTRKSERKNADAETGKMLAGVSANEKMIKAGEYQSPAEIAVYYFKKEHGQMRNKQTYAYKRITKGENKGQFELDDKGQKIPIIKDGVHQKEGSYLHTFNRLDLENELKLIFERQKSFGNSFAQDNLCGQLCHLLTYQKDAGSFGDTREKVGSCSFEPDEERAPKNCYTAERFNFIQKINNLRIKQDGQERALNDDERRLLKDILFRKLLPEEAKQMGMRKEYLDDGITYAQLRKLLFRLPENAENARFNIGYHLKNNMEKLLNDALKPVKIKNKFANISKKEKDNILYDIEHILISHQGQPEQIVQKMQKYQQHFSENEISAISKIVLLSEKQKLAEIEKKEKFFNAEFFYKVKEAYEKHNLLEQWESLKDNSDALDKLGSVVSLSQKDKEIEDKINSDDKDLPHSDYVFSQDEIKAICEELPFKGFHHLSLECMKKLLPEMENGLRYDKACEKVYGNHYGRSKEKYEQETLPPIDKSNANVPNSPVVYRTITQARKVINAIIAKHGKPFMVHIELTRELGKSRESREEIKDRQDKNREERQIARNQAIAELAEKQLSTTPSEKDILKFRLYKHQDCHCAYCDCELNLHRLLEQSYVEIEHILPKSRSQDDSFDNKVLACRKCNQDKTNLTPYEWFNLQYGENSEKWQNFVGRVKANPHFSYRKKQNLLRKDLPKEFVGRDLSETRHITRFLKNYIEKYPNIFSGSPTYMSEDGKEHSHNQVFCPQGSLTSALRASWGFSKIREENDRHHALDAIVVACATTAMQQKLTAYYQWYERRYKKDEWSKEEWEKFTNLLQRKQENIDKETGEIKYFFPVPRGFPEWFNTEINLRVFNQVPKRDENGDIVRVENKIQYEPLNNPYQKEELLDALAKHLPNCPQAIHDNVTPLFVSRMPKKGVNSSVNDDTISQIVAKQKDGKYTIYNKKKKSEEANKTGIEMRGGFAGNGSMIRIDVFADSKGKNHCEPIYLSQLADYYSGKPLEVTTDETGLPVPTDKKGKRMDFRFSLYPFDLIGMEDENGKIEYAYYRGFDSSTGTLTLQAPDADERKSEKGKDKGQYRKSVGKLGDKLQKCAIDILGKNIIKIEKEERQGFEELFKDDDE